jgi:hypothetical protein
MLHVQDVSRLVEYELYELWRRNANYQSAFQAGYDILPA